MKVTISTLVLLVIGVSYVSSQMCHLREIDLCMSVMIFNYQSNGVPADDEKVTEWCESVTEVSGCMGNFSDKCLTPMQKELVGLLSGGSSDAEKQLCTAGSELRNRYLKHATCLAEGAESDEFKTYLKDFQVAIETVFEVDFKKRLPTLCCGARRFHKDTEENTLKKCGAESVDMLKVIMDMVFTELPHTLCQNYDPESDTCKQLLPPSGTPPKGAQSKSQISKLLDTVIGGI